MSRVIHWRSAGGRWSTFYECYRLELEKSLDKKGPQPKSLSDINRVTCPHCLYLMSLAVARQVRKHGATATVPTP